MTSPVDWSEVAKVTIPSLVTIAGWMIVFQQSVTSGFKTDVKSIMDNACSTCDDIFELSMRYYKGDEGHIGFHSADIRSKFLLLSHYLILMKNKGITFDFTPYLIAYRKAVMGDHFETEQYKKQLEIPDRKSDIANSRSELHFRITKSYIDWSRGIGFISQFSLK